MLRPLSPLRMVVVRPVPSRRCAQERRRLLRHLRLVLTRLRSYSRRPKVLVGIALVARIQPFAAVGKHDHARRLVEAQPVVQRRVCTPSRAVRVLPRVVVGRRRSTLRGATRWVASDAEAFAKREDDCWLRVACGGYTVADALTLLEWEPWLW